MDSLVHVFTGDERVVADKGYRGHPEFFDNPWKHLDNKPQCERKALARARHETINARFKKCVGLPHQPLEAPLHLHGLFFYVVANIEQSIIGNNGMWKVAYNGRVDNQFDL